MEKHFSAAAGSTGRVIAARILPDLDVLETIGEICQEYGISYGQISTCIGSLRSVAMNYVSTANPAPGQKYTTLMTLEGAFNVLAGQGLVSPGDDPAKRDTHIHFVISGQHDAIYGGHLLPGTRTLTTLDLFITELHGIAIVRGKDPATGAVVTNFAEAQ